MSAVTWEEEEGVAFTKYMVDVETSSTQSKDAPSEKLLKLCKYLARQKDNTFWMHRRQLTSARLRKDAGLDGKAAHSP